MTPFKMLLDSALAGTQRKPPPQFSFDGPVATLLRDIAAAPTEPARQVLQMAAVLGTCEQAGFMPAAALPVPQASAHDDRPSAPASMDPVLRHVIAEGPERLQHETFRRLAATSWRLPHQLLPAALELARRSVALRATLADVLGERGRWLAARNPAWRFAAGTSQAAPLQEQWEFGTPEQRRAVFAQMRKQDAHAARDRLAAELPQLAARERAELLPLLGAQLSPADETLLDGLLKDRSKEVRQAAATLLLRLPQSRHAQAICDALKPLVRKEGGFLGSRLMIEAPTQADASWKDEAIDITRPASESLGERAWWLFQLVRQAPTSWWMTHTGMQPADLIKAAGKGEWKEALYRGWRDATLAGGDAAWAEALLAAWDTKTMGHDSAAMLAQLPLAQRERHWQRALDGNIQLPGLLGTMLVACPPGWPLSRDLSLMLTRAILPAMAADATSPDYHLRQVLPDLLCLLDVTTLDAIAALSPRADAQPSHVEFSQRMVRIASARRALAALPASPSSHPERNESPS